LTKKLEKSKNSPFSQGTDKLLGFAQKAHLAGYLPFRTREKGYLLFSCFTPGQCTGANPEIIHTRVRSAKLLNRLCVNYTFKGYNSSGKTFGGKGIQGVVKTCRFHFQSCLTMVKTLSF